MGKGFKGVDSPTSFFISEPVEVPETVPEKVPDKKKTAHEKPEGKTKRVQLVVKPSLYDAVKQRAETEDISVNALITKAIKQYLAEV